MSEIQEITVIVSPDGTVSLEVDGVSGAKCEALTEALEQALGGQVLERRYKDSYTDEATVENPDLDVQRRR